MSFPRIINHLMIAVVCGLMAPSSLMAFQDNGQIPSGQFRSNGTNRTTSKSNTTSQTSFRNSNTRQDGGALQEQDGYPASGPLRPRNEKYVDVMGGLTSPVAKVAVPARTNGPLSEMNVVEMQEVTEHDVMGKIDTTMAMLQVDSANVQLEAAQAKASDNVAIRYAQKGHNLAKKEMEITYKLAKNGAATKQEYERSRLAAEQAELQIEKSSHDLMVAGKEALVEKYKVNAAETNLTRHEIKAPLSGNVVQILKQPGEWVNEGEEVFRIIQLNRIRVEGLVALENYSPNEIFGRPVTVTLKSAGKSEVFEGRVVMVDMETNNGQRYTVRAEIEHRRAENNTWVLISGASVEMRVHLQDPVASNPDGNETSKFSPN